MRALLLAPFTEQAIAELVAAGVDVVHEDWLETGTMQDPGRTRRPSFTGWGQRRSGRRGFSV